MKAAVYRHHGKDPRQVVKIEDVDVPRVKPNEVLIKVEAAYNHDDLWGIWGEPIKIPMPHISGSSRFSTGNTRALFPPRQPASGLPG